MDNRQNFFLLQIIFPRGLKRREKKFERDRKKKKLDPIALYVLQTFKESPDI